MRGDWRPHHWAMQFDLEHLAELGWYMQVLAVCIQPHIAARLILAQLDAMPAIRSLEAGKANRQTEVFHLQEPFERLTELVRESPRLQPGDESLPAR